MGVDPFSLSFSFSRSRSFSRPPEDIIPRDGFSDEESDPTNTETEAVEAVVGRVFKETSGDGELLPISGEERERR